MTQTVTARWQPLGADHGKFAYPSRESFLHELLFAFRPTSNAQARPLRPNHQRLALIFFQPNIIPRVQEKEFQEETVWVVTTVTIGFG